MPVPVDTARFPFRPKKRASRFVSVYGFGGIGDRRGLPELAKAWARCTSAAPELPALILRAQKDPPELNAAGRECVHVRVANTTEPAELFEGADVAVQPSRFEGVGLSLLEAQACGLPVITVDAEPMRTLAPDLLATVGQRTSVSIMGKPVSSHVADVGSLADRVVSIFGRDISDLSHMARKRVEEQYSWDALRTLWVDLLRGTVF
jgi:glycosyltransferase involved in cell wall biosynthesis